MAPRSRHLIGRDAELEGLVAELGIDSLDPVNPVDPVGGPRRHVLLSGDAGVGKTRLLTELRDRAVARGWQVHAGHCFDFGESAESYLPFAEIVDRLVTAAPDLVARIADEHPALLRMAPVSRALGVSPPARSEALDRGNLFAAIHALADAAGAQAPAILVVEDTHWADQSTRDLLTFLFTRPFRSPVGLVASYRSDDLHRRHPLRRQVAEWTRLPGVERMTLEPLTAAAVRRLVLELDATLSDAEVADVVERADGNAFFVEELVEAAATPGGSIPDDLADVLLVRLDRLDDPARQVVRTASVAGRQVGHDMLTAVTGLDEATLDAGLRQAVELNVLVPGEHTYAFRHALLGEAAYDELLPGERERLHRRYTEALRDGTVRGTAAELARHARAAGDRETALAAGIRAGDDAAAGGGPNEAAQHYQQAIGLLAEQPDHDPGALVALVVKAADAMIDAGQADRAARLARDQLGRLPAGAPGLWRAELLAAEIEASFAYVDGRHVLPLSEEAVEALPADAPPDVRARVLAAHTRVLMIERRHDEAERAGREALALAEGLGRHALAADVAVTLAAPWGRPVEERIEDLTAAVARAEKAGALQPEFRGRLQLGIGHDSMGRLDEAVEWYLSAHERALAKGMPWAPYAFDARICLLGAYFIQGRWDDALALTDAPGVPAALAPWLESQRLMIEQARGADVGDRARRLRPSWRQEIATAVESAVAEIVAAGRRGDVAGVVEAYDAAAAGMAPVWGTWFESRVRLAAVAIGQIASCLATLAAAERADALDHVRRLREDGLRVDTRRWGPEGKAWRLRLDAEALRAHWLTGVDAPSQEELIAVWRETEAAYAAFGHVHELAWVRATLAAIARATGDRATARQLSDLARATARSLGAQPLLDELRAQGAAPARQPGPSDQLTARELEILALVAHGRSNGEIGKQLFISAKTVSVHVSNILAKLGAAGRTEAAAIGRRRGLVE